jgi:hypothetical protein
VVQENEPVGETKEQIDSRVACVANESGVNIHEVNFGLAFCRIR